MILAFHARLVDRGRTERSVYLLSVPHQGDMLVDDAAGAHFLVRSVEINHDLEGKLASHPTNKPDLTIGVQPWPENRPKPSSPVVCVVPEGLERK